MDQEGQWASIDIDKVYILKVYKEGENDHNKGAHAILVENSPLFSLPLVVTIVLEEIQSSSDNVYTARG